MAVRGIAGDSAKWEISHRYLSGQIERATQRSIVMVQLRPDLKAGLEWNHRAGEVGVVANWRAVSEEGNRPAVIFGTSSDRIGTPSGQAYYVTVSRSLQGATGLPLAPYAGISYSTYEARFLYPFGLSAAFGERWSAMLINDGVHTHLSLTHSWNRFAFTLLAVERKNFGITAGARF